MWCYLKAPITRILMAMFAYMDGNGRNGRTRSPVPRRRSGPGSEWQHEEPTWDDNGNNHSWEGWAESRAWKQSDTTGSAAASSWQTPASPVGHHEPQQNWPRRSPPSEERHQTWDSWKDSPVLPVSAGEDAQRSKHNGGFRGQVQTPSQFTPNAEYWDTNVRFDLPLPRRVFVTEWTQDRAIATCEITEVPLYKVLFKGISNWCLRHLAAGKACYFIMVRSYQHSCIFYSMTRDLRQTDMEVLARAWNKSLPTPLDEDNKDLLDKYGEHLAQIVKKDYKPSDQRLMDRIKELEKELADKKFPSEAAKASGEATPTVVSTYERKTNQKKHLGVDAPGSKKPADVNAYMKRVLTPQQIKKLNSNAQVYKDSLSEVEEDHVEFTRVLLVGWGMPTSLAAQFEIDNGAKVLVAVQMLEQA